MSSLYSLSLDSAHLESLEQLSDKEYWEYVHNLIQDTNSRHAAMVASLDNTMPAADECLECLLKQGSVLIPLSSITEVMPPPSRYTPLSATPPWMYGLVAWLGESIAVIDLEAYLANTSCQSLVTPATQNYISEQTHNSNLSLLETAGARIEEDRRAADERAAEGRAAEEGVGHRNATDRKAAGTVNNMAADADARAEDSRAAGRVVGSRAGARPTPTIFITRIGDIVLGLWVRGIGETIMLPSALPTCEINGSANLGPHDKEQLANQGPHNIPVWVASSRAPFLNEVSEGIFMLNMSLLLADIVHAIETVTSYE